MEGERLINSRPLFQIAIIYEKLYNKDMDTNMRKMNKQQMAYEYILNKITEGIYGPGYRIVIDQLAKELGTSPIPVREAIRQLEADGLIEYKPYTGAIVSTINEREYLETLSVLAVMEGYATALCSQVLTSEEIKALREINEKMKGAILEFDFERFSVLNREFHTQMYQSCGNQFLVESVTQIWQRLDRLRRTGFSFVPKRCHESIAEHEHMLCLIEQKAPLVEIEAYAREHKLKTARAFQERQKG